MSSLILEVPQSSSETVLVTGVCGFIASHLAHALLRSGVRVIGVDQRPPGSNVRRLQDQARFELVVAQLQDGDLAGYLRGVTKVFHLAAATNVQDSWGAGFSDHAISTVLGTQRLLSACRQAGVPRVMVASSSHVYGMTAELAREDAPLNPMSPYGVAKLAAERLAVAYAHRSGAPMSVVALRHFTAYGPHCPDAMVVMRLFRAALTGRPMPLYGDGTQLHSWTHVDDIVAATLLAGHLSMDAGDAEVVNVAGPDHASLTQVVDLVAQITGRRVPLTRSGARAGDAASTCADLTRARQVLGFVPQVGVEDGLTRQWRWLNRELSEGQQVAPAVGLVSPPPFRHRGGVQI